MKTKRKKSARSRAASVKKCHEVARLMRENIYHITELMKLCGDQAPVISPATLAIIKSLEDAK